MQRSMPRPSVSLARSAMLLVWLLPGLSVWTILGAGDAAADRSGQQLPQAQASAAWSSPMKIRLIVNGRVLTATLLDNATSRDLATMLPLTLTLEDYAGTEKIAYPPRKLSVAGAPPGSDPSVGDITYYAPWGNLAIFYKDFSYARGLVLLGKLEGSIEALTALGSTQVTIELAKD